MFNISESKAEVHGRCKEHEACWLVVMPETHGFIFWHAPESRFTKNGDYLLTQLTSCPEDLQKGKRVVVDDSWSGPDTADYWWIDEESATE